MRRLLFVATALFALSGVPALAHEDRGQFEDVAVQAIEPLTISVAARLIYPNDGEPAEGATVTAVAEQPGAPAVPPTPLQESSPGQYGGEIAVPGAGAWTVRLTALSPAATTVTVVDVAAPASTTTTEAPTTSTTTTTAATGDEAGDAGADVNPLMVAVMVAVAAGLTFVVWTGVRRRRADER